MERRGRREDTEDTEKNEETTEITEHTEAERSREAGSVALATVPSRRLRQGASIGEVPDKTCLTTCMTPSRLVTL